MYNKKEESLSSANSVSYTRTEDGKLVVKEVDIDKIIGEGASKLVVTSGAS